MQTFAILENMHRGHSLYGSQGDQSGSELFTEVITRIAHLKEKRVEPEARARVLIDAINIVSFWCGIDTLGVKSVGEEIKERYHICAGQPVVKKPVAEVLVPNSLRITPLYAPRDAADSVSKVKEHDSELQYLLLFVDTDGKVICMTSFHKIERFMIAWPHRIKVDHVTDMELASYLSISPLMLDTCLCELIKRCLESIDRARKREHAAKKSLDALIVIVEAMRRNDLTLAILLSDKNFTGMPGSGLAIQRFRNLCKLAGSTPEERMKAFEQQLKILGWKMIGQISRLENEQTAKIIENPDFEPTHPPDRVQINTEKLTGNCF